MVYNNRGIMSTSWFVKMASMILSVAYWASRMGIRNFQLQERKKKKKGKKDENISNQEKSHLQTDITCVRACIHAEINEHDDQTDVYLLAYRDFAPSNMPVLIKYGHTHVVLTPVDGQEESCD